MTRPITTPTVRKIAVAPSMILIVVVLAGGVARGQFDRGIGVLQVFDSSESSFDQSIFGDGSMKIATLDQLDPLLMKALTDLDRHCSLTDAQRRKLILAGQGDGKRFLDRVAQARRVFLQRRSDPDASEEIMREVRPLAAEFQSGLYGDGSFFAKAVNTTLDPEQVSRLRQALLEKARFRYRAKVALVLTSLDLEVGFSRDQQERYAALILAETTPPRRGAGPYEANVVLLKIAGLAEARARPIFDDLQWKTLDQIFRQARGMEAFLRSEGYLD